MSTQFDETQAPLEPFAPIRFVVFGRPAPQGSKRHVGHGIMIESSKRLKPWRQELASTMLNALHGAAIPFPAGPVRVDLNFYFERPKSAKKRKGMTVKPDLDKICRACFDAMTGIVIHDDSQIVELHAVKRYGVPERVEVEMREAIV